MKKLFTVVCALAIAASSVAGIYIPAAAEDEYEAVLEESFDEGVESITDEGAVADSQCSGEDGAARLSASWETFHIGFEGNAAYPVSDNNRFRISFDVKTEAVGLLGIGLGDTQRNNGALWCFSVCGNSPEKSLGAGSVDYDANKFYALKDADNNSVAAQEDTWYSVEAYIDTPSMLMTTTVWKKDEPETKFSRSFTVPSHGNYIVGGTNGTEISAVRLISARAVTYVDNLKVERRTFFDDSVLYEADFDETGTLPKSLFGLGAPQITGDADKYLSLNGTWDRYRQALAASVDLTSEKMVSMSFDVRFAGNNRNGIGLGTANDGDGSCWVISYNGKGLVMGSNENNEGSKIAYFKDSAGNKPELDTDAWYTVTSTIEFPSKQMNTSIHLRDAEDPVVYSASMTVPAFASYNVGGLKDGVTAISHIAYMSVGGMDIDNMLVTQGALPEPTPPGQIFYADFDETGTLPGRLYNVGTAAIEGDGDKYLALDGSWERYRHALTESISTESYQKVNMSFDVRFAGNNRSGIGLGTVKDDDGLFWLISNNGTGLVMGSNENTEKDKIEYLTDSAGNRPAVDADVWYRVESSIEFPSKLMSTKLYERDAVSPVIYSAYMTAPANGNYMVGGVKDSVTQISHIGYMSLSGMDIDNILVEAAELELEVKKTALTADGGIAVTFNRPVESADGILIDDGNAAYSYEVSADGLTVILTPRSALDAGEHTVTVPVGFASADGATLNKTYTDTITVIAKDELILGYHPFDNGKDNGSNLGLAGQGSDWGSLEYDEDNDNYYLHATKGSGGVGAWNPWSWLPSGSTSKDIDSYWNSSAVSKYISVEFDIRSCGVPTNLERVYFSHAHNHQIGLEILGMNASSVAMGEPEASRVFSGISNLTPGEWYHYKYILDITGKRAMAELSNGENVYTKNWTDLSGAGEGYWKDSLTDSFNTIAFQLPGGDIDLDNFTFKKYYIDAAVNADRIVLKSGSEVQEDWTAVSTATDSIEINFGTEMKASTLNPDTVYVTKKGDSEKLETEGAFSDNVYKLNLKKLPLEAEAQYELHIKGSVENRSGSALGEDYTMSFTTAKGSISARLVSFEHDGNAVSDISAFNSLAGEKLDINVNYLNTTGKAGKYNVIVCCYSGTAMVSSAIFAVEKTADEQISSDRLEYTVPGLSGITMAKAFIWNNLDEMVPLGTYIEVK